MAASASFLSSQQQADLEDVLVSYIKNHHPENKN